MPDLNFVTFMRSLVPVIAVATDQADFTDKLVAMSSPGNLIRASSDVGFHSGEEGLGPSAMVSDILSRHPLDDSPAYVVTEADRWLTTIEGEEAIRRFSTALWEDSQRVQLIVLVVSPEQKAKKLLHGVVPRVAYNHPKDEPTVEPLPLPGVIHPTPGPWNKRAVAQTDNILWEMAERQGARRRITALARELNTLEPNPYILVQILIPLCVILTKDWATGWMDLSTDEAVDFFKGVRKDFYTECGWPS